MRRRRPRPVSLRVVALLAVASCVAAGCGGGGGGPASGTGFPAGVVHGPLLGAPDGAALVVAWRTTAPSVGAVELGPTAAYGTTVAEAGPTTDHEVPLPATPAGATFHFRLLADGQPLGGDHAARALPGPSGPLRVAVAGDMGTGSARSRAVASRLEAFDPHATVLLGDVAYDQGTEADLERGLLAPWAPLLGRAATFVALGNHDAATAGGAPTLAAFPLPVNDDDGTEHRYAVTLGPLHLVVLDSNLDLGPGSAQRAWLDADLAAASAPWRVVAFHHPVYSGGPHGDTPGFAASLGPVLDARGVDLVLNGHDHDYERTHPLLAGAVTDPSGGPTYTDPVGPVYVVSGGGGAELDPVVAAARTAVAATTAHGLELVVTPTHLTVTARRPDGSVVDGFTLAK